MSDLEEVTSEKKSGISRRTVAKGMAWSVPAVALAVAAPAYAASPCTPVPLTRGASCKCPGGSDRFKFGYILQICVTVGNACALPPGVTNAAILGIENNSGKPLTAVNVDRSPDRGAGHGRSEPAVGTRDPLHSESSASTLVITYSISWAGPAASRRSRRRPATRLPQVRRLTRLVTRIASP